MAKEHSQLDYNFYKSSCPNLTRLVKGAVWAAVKNDSRMAASLLRLHFHDCFVNGCDASLLLDDTANFTSEKNAGPNRNSTRGFEVVDTIKASVEKECPATVSCSDILALAARDSVFLMGGPYWYVYLGRRDGKVGSESAANSEIPGPSESLDKITDKFVAKGLNLKDVVVLSGGHTFGFAKCSTFSSRLFNHSGTGSPDPTLDSTLLEDLQSQCPNNASDTSTNLAPLDRVTTNYFDNVYYKNLINNLGLLKSDQALLTNNQTASMVANYSYNQYLFFKDFMVSMVKMANISVLTGQDGDIRKNCRFVNDA
ncbi:hypothetical protein AMTR_s00169p00032570 [Amborella trichopoda]|uniref:Peroxidase n=1 Tax=Amborella trichopoda TaxID=13333 RepID=W1PQY3_AMBTC|nr:hypothetical protein AMTR_s00169p00032570 [Amborella trichopoda]